MKYPEVRNYRDGSFVPGDLPRRQGEGPIADEVSGPAETFPGRLRDLVLERSYGRC